MSRRRRHRSRSQAVNLCSAFILISQSGRGGSRPHGAAAFPRPFYLLFQELPPRPRSSPQGLPGAANSFDFSCFATEAPREFWRFSFDLASGFAFRFHNGASGTCDQLRVAYARDRECPTADFANE